MATARHPTLQPAQNSVAKLASRLAIKETMQNKHPQNTHSTNQKIIILMILSIHLILLIFIVPNSFND